LLRGLFLWSGLGRDGNYLRLFFSEIETSLVVLSVAGLVMVLLLVVPEVPAEAVVVDLVLVVEAVHPPLVLALCLLFVLALVY
jgi:hypothetical protein